ncbi:MAG: methionyl-tRNA formyltransferase [Parachlamydiaceae bacterium]|nr:methionyl-tRNA formyltransferase [Parachlamydiaceae bacterium]
MKIIYFGTPSFAADVIEYLFRNKVEIVAVVSKPDRPKGRSGSPVPTPVKTVALAINPSIPIYQPEIVSAPEFSDVLKQYNADLFVVVAYGEIIKQHLLDMPRLGCINVHASLLPKYRGAAPIQRSIIDGEAETGVTIMHMVKKMDAGDMIKVVKVPIGPEMTYGELEVSLCEIGKKALLDVLSEFEKGVIKRVPQDISQITFAPKIELEDCEIKWGLPAQQLHNLVRGVNPHPGAWCFVHVRGEKKRLKVMRTRVYSSSDIAPGKILSTSKQNLIVGTEKDALELIEVQLEGKKPMSSSELIRGIPLDQLSFSSN